MVRVVLPIVSCSLLVGLLWAEKTDSYKLILLFKAPLSSLFVLTAALLPHHFKRYCRLVITGLILGLVGDICLALPGNMPFRFGLVAFLGGHVFYILAFAQQTQRTDWFHSVNFLILAFSGYVLWWLYPHLGSMTYPCGLLHLNNQRYGVRGLGCIPQSLHEQNLCVVHIVRRSFILRFRHLCRKESIYRSRLSQSTCRAAALLHWPVYPGLFSWFGGAKDFGKSRVEGEIARA